MTDYELLQKLRETVKSIEEYQKGNNTTEAKGLWSPEIKALVPELITKSFVLGAAGRPCSKCGGSGRE